jgi:hypothetical protein
MINILPQLSIQVLAVRLIAGGTHMQYILLIHHDEQAWDKMDEATQKQIYGEFRQFREEFTASGHFLGGSQLQPSSATTTVRVRDGKRLVTDGPFAETREQLGGYILMDARDLDEAIGIAARIPVARLATIEVRPLEPGAPTTASRREAQAGVDAG